MHTASFREQVAAAVGGAHLIENWQFAICLNLRANPTSRGEPKPRGEKAVDMVARIGFAEAMSRTFCWENRLNALGGVRMKPLKIVEGVAGRYTALR